MPLINVPGVGTVNFPSTMSNEQIVEAIERDILPGRAGAAQQAPAESRMEPVPDRGFFGTVGARAGDFAGSLASGAGSVATGVGGIGGLLGITGYENVLSRLGNRASEFGSELMSPELRNQRRVLADAMKEAEERGFAAEAGAALTTLATNPGLLASMAVEQIPAFILSGGVGRAASLAGQMASRGGARAGVAAVDRAGQVGAIGTAAGLQTGGIAEETYREVMGLPAETINNSPNYQRLLQTMSPDEARQAIANRAAREAAALGGAVSVAAMTALPGAEKALFTRGVSQNALRRALGIGAAEFVSEGAEEGGGEFAQNLGIQRQADPSRDLLRGVGGAAATGAVLGGTMGAGIGALQRPPVAAPPSERPDLRGAIEDIVSGRGPAGEDATLPGGQGLLPREQRSIQTELGDLTPSQFQNYMNRRLPELMATNPELASRLEYAQTEAERNEVFRDFISQEQAAKRAEFAQGRQQADEAAVPGVRFPVPPVREAAPEQPRAQPELPVQPELPTRMGAEPPAPRAPIVQPAEPAPQAGVGSPAQTETFNIPVGRQFSVSTPDGSMSVDVVPEVVDLFSLTPASGGLQNRMIDNPANQATISNIQNAPDFTRLSTSPYSDRGAPIVGPDNIIEVGNHRVEGLKRGAENNPEAFQGYVRSLNEAGYNTSGMRFPVLIRRRVGELSPEQRQDFTRLSNTDANQALSDLEMARQDASRLTPELLAKFDGEVTGGIRAAKNLPFVRDFMSQIATPSERARLVTSEGGVSDAFADRLERALFASAYNNIDLIKRAVESGDDDTKSITGGMIEATGAMQELRRGIESGRIRPEFGIVNSLMTAADRIRAGKANGLTPGDILATEDMINPVPPLERELIKLLSNDNLNKIASKSAIGKRLKAFVEEAKTQTTDADLVGGERRITPEEAAVAARNPGQVSMFSARRTGAAEGPAAPESEETAPNQDTARQIVNKYLSELRAMGRQGRLIANALEGLLKNGAMNTNQIYQAFMVGETLAKTLPTKADYRVRFLQDIIVDNEQAGTASGAKVGERAQGRVIYPTESLPGFIELSLAEDMLPLLRETAAHEAFHVLQSYFSNYDVNFADRINKFFKDGMKVSDLEPSIKRRLQGLRVPGQKTSYYDALVQGLGDAPLSAKEAQAYAFGALIDAANRGQKVTGLIPSFQRFITFARDFLNRMKRGLTGDGFTAPADILTQAQQRGAAMEQAAPAVTGAAYSGRAIGPEEAMSVAAEANKQYLQGLITAKERDSKVKEAGVRYNVVDMRTKAVVGSWPTMSRARAEADKRDQQYGGNVFKVKPTLNTADQSYSARKPLHSGQPLADTISVDGVDRPTTNDQDRPIHPTDDGTRNFWRWFGDSKVVDNDGRPVVLYHGTSKDVDFSAFKMKDRGIWFADSPKEASSYATDNESMGSSLNYSTGKYESKNVASRVIPAYLSIKNPKTLTPEESNELRLSANYAKAQASMFRKAVSDGYDGIDMGGGVWVALKSPTQIKSAVGNTGAFSPTEGKIQFSARRVPSEYAARSNGNVAGLSQFGQRVPGSTPAAVNAADLGVQYDVASRYLGKKLGRFVAPEKVENFFTKMQDSMLPVGRMIDDIKASGGSVPVAMDAYLKEDLLQGKVADMLDKRGKSLYTPVVEAVSKSGLTMQDFENYLYARHAPERNAYIASINPKLPDGGSGLTNAEAKAMMAEFQRDGKMAKLNNLASMFDKIIADTNSLRVESGLTPDFSKITKAEDGRPLPNYKNYAPLRGFADESVDADEGVKDFRPKTGKMLGARGREDKRMTGRERMAGDILAHAIMQNTQAVIRSEQNKVGQSFLAMVRANPSQTKDIAEVVASAPIKTTIVDGVVKAVPDMFYKNSPDILVVKEGGKEIAIRIKDEGVARSMTGASALSPTSKNILLQGMATLNRFLAKINTAYNPEFLITNFARDLQTFGVNVQQYNVDGIAKDSLRDLKGALSGVRDSVRGTDNNPEMKRAFERFRALGGTTEMYGFGDLESRIAEINKIMAEAGGQAKSWKDMAKTVAPVIKFIEDYNTIVENGIRTSLFKNLTDRGINEERAAQIAKNVTVNFTKGGENKVLMNSLYLFYNASLQGTMAMVNALGRSSKVRKIVAGVVVAGVLQDVMNAMLSDMDDDDEKVYDKIPDHILKRSFVMMDPFKITERGYFSFPMPYGFNAFFNMGREMSKASRGQSSPGEAAGNIIGTFVDAFNPIGGSENFYNFMAPTFADPIIDVARNRDFTDRPIVPERGGFGVQLPDSQKYWNNTFAPYVSISNFVNSLTGGTPIIPGAVDISPNMIQYVVNFATGGVGKFVERSFNTATSTIPDMLRGDLAELDVKGIPFARSLYGSVTSREDMSVYMDRMEEVLRVRKEISDASQSGQPERVNAAIERYPGQVQIMESFNRLSRDRAKISQSINEISRNQNIPDDSKREIIKSLREQQNSLARLANRLYVQNVENR